MPVFAPLRGADRQVSRPRSGVVVSGIRDDYAAELGKIGIDPARLGRTLRAADTGDTRAMYEVFSYVEHDPHVMAVLGKRRRAVISRTLSITPQEVDEGSSQSAQDASDICNEVIFGSNGVEGIANLHEWLYDLTDAIGRGFSLGEVSWVFDAELWRIRDIRHWPQRDCVLGKPFAHEFDADQDEVRILTLSEPTRGEPLPQWQFVCHKHKARTDILARAALLRSVCWWVLFKTFAAKDWAIFSEMYGTPLRIGKYGHGTSKEDRAALREAIIDIGRDGGAILPDNCMIELLDSKLAGQLPQPQLATFCNQEISKAILGNTLTTEVGSTGGNRALGEVHEGAEFDITEWDSTLIADTIRNQVCRPIVNFNLGPGFPVPKVDFWAEEERAQLDRAQRDEILIRSIGLPVTKDYLYKTYEVQVPEEGQELVEPPTAAVSVSEDLPDPQDVADVTDNFTENESV